MTAQPLAASHLGLLAPANGLNLVRLVLVSLVVLSHSFTLGAYSASPELLGSTSGKWALAGLFAVSGFLVAGGRSRMSFVDFVLRRAWRLWPAYLACLVVIAFGIAPIGYLLQVGTIEGFLDHPDGGPIRFVTMNAFFEIRQLPISGTPYSRPAGWVGNLWTVSHTVACYVVVGAILGIRRDRLRLGVTIAVLVLAVVGYATRDGLSVVVQDPRVTEGLLRFLPSFLGGVVVHQLRHRIRSTWPLAALCVVLTVVAAAISPNWGLQAASPCIAYALLWLGNAMPSPALLQRNDLAFGVFIYGYAVQSLLGMLGVAQALGHPLLFFVASMLATLPFAIGSWLLVERPLLRHRRAPGASASAARFEPA